MKLRFTKMQGCGNDYIYFDCFQQEIAEPEKLSIRLSQYHFGIGGDGIICICPSEVADAKMRIFNQDGSEGKMCGNGIRCVGKYLYEHGYLTGETARIETLSGIKILRLSVVDGKVIEVCVDMGKAEFAAEKIPVRIDKEEAVNYPAVVGGREERITCVSMGNPHCVIFCEEPDALNLEEVGLPVEQDSMFPERVNTEFIKVMDAHNLKMRVWERGSGETLACGTGACASVAAAVRCGFCPENEEITVHLKGGALNIRYTKDTVFMTGGAEVVFEGEVEI